MNGLLEELREGWNDAYWWADHELLAATLVAVITAIISLAGVYLETRLQQRVA